MAEASLPAAGEGRLPGGAHPGTRILVIMFSIPEPRRVVLGPLFLPTMPHSAAACLPGSRAPHQPSPKRLPACVR